MIKKTSVFNLRDAFFAVMGLWLIIFLDDCKPIVLISILTIGNPSDSLIGLDVGQLIYNKNKASFIYQKQTCVLVKQWGMVVGGGNGCH